MSPITPLQAWSQCSQPYNWYPGKSKLSYDPTASGITDTDELFEQPQYPLDKKHAQSARRCYKLAIVSLLGGFALMMYAIMTATSSQDYPDKLSTDLTYNILRSPCGTSAAEARASGCHFDIITFCWLPDRCYDAELSNTFNGEGEWEYFHDLNKTQRVDKSEALTGEYDGLYVSWRYHVMHCVYMWEKMHRALLGMGKPAIDSYIGPLAHTRHCGMMLTKRGHGFDFSDFNTRIKVKYPDCGIE